jgi:radical SAM superfamily enzyme YgiQ (UPF0313 family)
MSDTVPAIVLATLNARYIHASLGLRYLLANMARHGSPALRAATVLREFTIARPTEVIVDELLATADAMPSAAIPPIFGFGVYLWNVQQTTAVVRRLKALRPEAIVVLGGPEVSHEWESQEIVALADYLITGWGDVSFPKLCAELAQGKRPANKVIAGEQAALDQIAFPYAEYRDEDLAHRLLYVEASRGCPFKCEFCLSSLDRTAWSFDLDAFLAELDTLYRRGARTFKFVDRTFNLKVETSARILQFFLDRLDAAAAEGTPLFLHFEVVPDHLPERLKTLIAQFPAGTLQLEVGVQTFDPAVQQRISRRQDNQRTEENLRWLRNHSQAHLHADLIFGLPGETLAGFAAGFDRLYTLGPHEIQLGILKRLRGTPIARHRAAFAMVYDPQPPYTVQSTGAVDGETLQRFTRLARYWDLIANSGRFPRSLPRLLAGPSAFAAMLAFADWFWLHRGETHGLTPEVLVDGLFDYLTTVVGQEAEAVRADLLADYLASGARANPACLQGWLTEREAPQPRKDRNPARSLVSRQALHGEGAIHNEAAGVQSARDKAA